MVIELVMLVLSMSFKPSVMGILSLIWLYLFHVPYQLQTRYLDYVFYYYCWKLHLLACSGAYAAEINHMGLSTWHPGLWTLTHGMVCVPTVLYLIVHKFAQEISTLLQSNSARRLPSSRTRTVLTSQTTEELNVQTQPLSILQVERPSIREPPRRLRPASKQLLPIRLTIVLSAMCLAVMLQTYESISRQNAISRRQRWVKMIIIANFVLFLFVTCRILMLTSEQRAILPVNDINKANTTLQKDLSGDARALRRLRTACERAKRTLSSGAQATIEIDSLFDGEDFTMSITRARFEDLNAKAFSGTIEPVAQVLKDAAIEKKAVDEIVLVGGSTRIPKIQKLLSEFFDGKKLEKSINPDEAVAYGAAVQAGILSGKATSAETSDLLLLDVVPLSLGVAMEGNIFAPVVPRGTTCPTLKKRTFTTVADNQQTVQFPVFQGERVNCEDNTSLGEFTLAPIPPMRAGEAVLECVFEVDVNGILKVTATEKTSGRSANITISNSVGKLTSDEIEKMVNDAEEFKSNDDAFQKKFEAKQQLESYMGRVEEIVSDPTLSLKLKRGQKEKIENTLSEAMSVLEISDSTAEDLKKQELALKRLVTKAMSSR
jgi:hypothetical protein